MRSSLRVINFIGATILAALLFVSIAVGQLRGFPPPRPPAPPSPTVVPRTLTFPPQMVGTRSAPKAITVTNIYPSHIIVRVSAPFQSSGCVRTPYNTCTINVTFAPVVVGPANANARIVELGRDNRVTLVTLSGTGVASTAEKAIHPTDFNGDSKPDLVWQNQSNGSIGVWFMNGSNRISAVNFSPGQIADTAWKIVGIADFNSDSKPDLVWQNQSNGQIGVWFMDGSNLMSATNFSPGQVSDTTWKIVGTGDFNSDSKPDLVWQNQSNGQIGVWFMDGINLISAVNFSPGQGSDTTWKIVGTGDFNSDSKPDLVWQNQSGHVWVWFMNGINLISAANFSPGQVSDTTWKIVGTGDFNSDSKPDLVWQNQSDGQIGVWFMDGINLINGTNFSPGQVSDLNWKIPNVWALQ